MNRWRHFAATLAVLAGLAVATGFVTYRLTSKPATNAALEEHDPLQWLRAEFDLDDAQFARIKALHESYAVVCAEHCLEIQKAERARRQLAESGADPAALAAAERRVEELRKFCESAIAAHVRECASHMSPESGSRYLALVLPKIADFDHRAAPDLQLNAHHHSHP